MQSESSNVKLLIKKISTGLQEIKLRSINTLYTKITLGVIDTNNLHTYTDMPGVLMNWINQNQKKSQQLYKVINIIMYFTKTDKGLSLLKQYQTLQFFQQLRTYIISHFTNVESYVETIQSIIRALLPLGRTLQTSSQNNNPNLNLNNQKQQQQNKHKVQHKLKKSQFSFLAYKQSLTQEEQKYIFDLTVQIKYGKKQTQYQTLILIKRFLQHYSIKYFRCKSQLFEQISLFIQYKVYPWICSQILSSIIDGLVYSQLALSKWQNNRINFIKNQILNLEKVTTIIQINPRIFQSIYSYMVIDKLAQNLKTQWINYLATIQFKFGYKHCLKILEKIDKSKLDNESITKMIKYYSQLFPECREYLINYCSNVQQVPSLNTYQSIKQSQLSYKCIQQYVKQNINLSINLPKISEIMCKLKQAIMGVTVNPIPAVSFYIDSFLIIVIALSKQDPLMSYYHQIRSIIIELSKHRSQEIRIHFYILLEKIIHNQDKIMYIKNQYIKSDILQIALCDEILLSSLLKESLSNEDTLCCMLEIIKKIMIKVKQLIIQKYQCILFALNYHPSHKVKSLSKVILERINHKFKTQLIKLFSKDQKERIATSKQIFNIDGDILQSSLTITIIHKKPLKVNYTTVYNYVNIFMKEQLDTQVRRSALVDLIDTLQRAEITQEITKCLIDLASILNQKIKSKTQIKYLQLYIDLYTLLLEKVPSINSNFGSQQSILTLMLSNIQQNTKKRLLKLLYLMCFQSPFSTQKSINWVMNFFPHHQIIEMEIQHPNLCSLPKIVEQKTNISIIPKSFKDFKEYVQWIISNYLRTGKNYQTIDINLLQKQINSIFKSTASYDALTLSSYLIKHDFINTTNQSLLNITTSLLNYLSTHQSLPLSLQNDILTILLKFPLPNNKQFQSFISSHHYPYLTLSILSLDVSLNKQVSLSNIENIIKIIKTLKCDEKCMGYRIIGKRIGDFKLNEFSSMTLITSLMKDIRQNDTIIKSTSLFCFHEVLKSFQSIDSINLIQNAVITCLSQDYLSFKHFILAVQCIKLTILRNKQQNQLIKAFVSKIVMMVNKRLPCMVNASIISFMNILLSFNLTNTIKQINIIDLVVSLLDKQQSDGSNEEWMMMIGSCCQFLALWSIIQPQTNHYLLSSTSTLQHIINLCVKDCWITHPTIGHNESIQMLGRLLNFLMLRQDYFVFKLNKISNDTKMDINIFKLLGRLCKYGGTSYLKMYQWLVAIEWKGRGCLEDGGFGYQLVKVYLDKDCIYLGNSLYAVSFTAKKALIESDQFAKIISKVNNLLDLKIIKDMRQKKKNILKSNQEVNTPSETHQQITNTVSMLCSLFHSSDQHLTIQLKKETVKKIFGLVEKLYIFITQHSPQNFNLLIKLISNLALSDQFSIAFSGHISEGNSSMLEDVCTTIIKFQHTNLLTKRSLLMLNILCKHQSVRSIIFRMKIIQDLNSRLIRCMFQIYLDVQHQKRSSNDLQSLYQIIGFYVSLSQHKDSNLKILVMIVLLQNDKKILEVMVQILTYKKSNMIQQKILRLLQNLTCFKQNKPIFLASKDVHKVLLWLLGEDVPYKNIIIAILYNICFKSAAAIKIYRKKEVIDLLKEVECTQNEQDVYHSLMEALEEGI